MTVPLTALRGVGEATAGKLAASGIDSVQSLLQQLPRGYQDRRHTTPIAELTPGADAVVDGVVAQIKVGRRALQLAVHDDSGSLVAVWFRPPRWLTGRFVAGQRVRLLGRVDRARPLRLTHPEVEDPSAPPDGVTSGAVVPVYSAPDGLGQRTMRKLVAQAFAAYPPPDLLPPSWRAELSVPSRADALRRIHFPGPDDDLDALRAGRHPAHEALLGEDLLLLQLALRRRRPTASVAPVSAGPLRQTLRAALPFSLTDGQERVLEVLDADLASGQPMQRLLQGDVGAGKTVVGLLAAAGPLAAGGQVAVLAPTDLLARQWQRRAKALLEPAGVAVVRLAGSQGAVERRAAQEAIASGAARFVVGTHALVQDSVRFADLRLVIVDEQQRFGVFQRARLVAKGRRPHLLATTATPIPRTLARCLFGDLDLVALEGAPPRGPRTTTLLARRDAEEAWAAVRAAAQAGERAFVVAPRIEGGVLKLAERLAGGALAGVRLGVVHGGMPPAARESALARLRAGELSVLVGTTVLEVGIDVPEATVLVVDEAERFGLSQLHQLRGRVGRSERGGDCYLLTHDPEQAPRLAVLTETEDGFAISAADLKRRGPGDLVGSRQAGTPAFRLYLSPRYGELLEWARGVAAELAARPEYQSDPALAALRAAVEQRLPQSEGQDGG